MIDPTYIDLVTSYLDGSITPQKRARLNELIEDGTIDILDIKEMQVVYRNMDMLSAPEPSQNLTDTFYLMLELEKEKEEERKRDRAKETSGSTIQNSLRKYAEPIPWVNTGAIGAWLDKLRTTVNTRQLGYGFAILLAGILIGNWATPFRDYRNQLNELSSEVSQMRHVMMISLLDNNSVTERLKAVNISTEMQTADKRISTALLKTLNNDPNVNVRLAAVEALIRHASDPEVRKGLIDAIDSQHSPLVQAELADAMLQLQEKRSVDEFKNLLDRESLDPALRDKLQQTIAALS